MTIHEAGRALRSRRISSVELTRESLARIERLNPKLNAFLTVTDELALAQAARADEELASGRDRGPLHGIPIAFKDLFLTRGIRTTGGSKLYENYVPQTDAAVVERLAEAGAVTMGKLNLHELAYGITSSNPHFGPVRNPANPEHIPGGSSGGSGAAVAAKMVFAAMGSDTGGSIRIPASFCGTAGLKPTYGLVSRYGTFPLGYSLDHMGPLAGSVRDVALVMRAIAGYDRRDPASAKRAAGDYVPAESGSINGIRIGVPENFYFDGIEAEVEAAVRGALQRAADLGAEVRPVRLPDVAALNAAAVTILLAEAAAVLQPFRDRRSDFGSDVLALLDQGRLIAATDYIQAQRLRRRLGREFARVWKDADCLIMPTTPLAAPRIGVDTVRLGGRDENVRMASTRLVRGLNALGWPALSIPCGRTATGLPIGLQIAGPVYHDAVVLSVGAALESC